MPGQATPNDDNLMTARRLQHTLAEDQSLVTQALEQLLQRHAPGSDAVHRAMRYGVLGHGQRIRPVLALRVARAAKGDLEPALRAGLAVELLHAASLIIDDLPCMDDAQTRRDVPTVHRVFGEATAVLAAIALVALAARLPLSEIAPGAIAPRLIDFVQRLLAAVDCSGLIAGQALDLGLDATPVRPSAETLAALKTAPLFELAARAGLLGAAPDPVTEADFLTFAARFGVAFQLADDYRDGELADPAAARGQLEAARRILAPYGQAAGALDELIAWLAKRMELS